MPTTFNEIQLLKRRFFAMRNGVIADCMRRAGSPYKIIFGLNLPQISEIAESTPHTREMAETLWQNRSTRESMLIAPMLCPVTEFRDADASQWVMESPTDECTDVLCHKLLRHMPNAYELAVDMASSPESNLRYAAMRVLWHFIHSHSQEIMEIAKTEAKRNDRHTLLPAHQITDEIEFFTDQSR